MEINLSNNNSYLSEETLVSLSEAVNITRINLQELSVRMAKISEVVSNIQFPKFETAVFSRANQVFAQNGIHLISKYTREELKNLRKNTGVSFYRLNRRLSLMSLDEVKNIRKYYQDNKTNEKVLILIEFLILKKEKIEWLAKFIKQTSCFIILENKILYLKRDFRFHFRKILSIHFKNLDDYHSYSIL